MKVLIFDPDVNVVETISLAVQVHWPHAEIVVWKQVEPIEYFFRGLGSLDIVLLELTLPDGNGLDVLAKIRTLSKVPVIILSEQKTEVIEARCLIRGADDYIRKPFNALVVLARMHALLRRTGNLGIGTGDEVYHLHGLIIDIPHMRVLKDEGGEIRLTRLQWRLLIYMIRNASKVISYEVLREEVWEGDGSYSAIKMAIRGLRVKLGDNPRDPKILHNHHALGYSLELPVE